jgi:hypothetical protein
MLYHGMRIHEHACMSSHTYKKEKGLVIFKEHSSKLLYLCKLPDQYKDAPSLLEIYACAERSF